MSYRESNGLWIPSEMDSKQTTDKGWQDILYSVRNNRLEELDISGDDSFSDHYIINRGISLLAQNVAQTPLVVYRSDQAITSPNHEVYRLFIKPSEDICEFELWERMIVYLYTKGESFFYLNKNKGNVIKEIYVLNPKYMEHEKDKDTGQIKSWVFNREIPMAKEDIIHFKLPSTHGLRGLSPLNAVLRELATDKSAAKYNKAFFDNSGRSDGYLKTDKDAQISPEEMRRVVAEWNAKHKGVDHAHSIGGLLGGMSYEDTGINQLDMDYAGGRRDIRDRLLTVLGLSKTVMGIAEDVNRANAEEAMRQLWELTLKPLLVRVQQKLNAELFIPYYKGFTCKFDLSNIEELKKDFNITLDMAQKLVDLGYTRNEINERLTLDMPASDDNNDLIRRVFVRRQDLKSLPVKTTEPAAPKEPKEPKKEVKPIIDKELLNIRREFKSKIKKYFFLQRKSLLKSSNDLDKTFAGENVRFKESLKQFSDKVDLEKLVDINKAVKMQLQLALLKARGGDISKEVRSIYNFLEKKLKEVAMMEIK